MFKSLKELLETGLMRDDGPAESKNASLELAAAVLMVEIALADSSFDDEERRLIETTLQQHFQLAKERTREIIDLAEKEVDHAVSLHDFTRLINESLSHQDRAEIVELLWRVAFADAVLDKYEEYYIRKVSDLLYVSHKDYIRAKHRASEKG